MKRTGGIAVGLALLCLLLVGGLFFQQRRIQEEEAQIEALEAQLASRDEQEIEPIETVERAEPEAYAETEPMGVSEAAVPEAYAEAEPIEVPETAVPAEYDETERDAAGYEYGIRFHTARRPTDDPRYQDYAVPGNFYEELQYRYESMISYPTDIVFLGDSLMAKGAWEEFYPGLEVKNRGINGDTINGIRARMESIIATQPSRIYLMVGINDILYGKLGSGQMERDYRQLLEELEETGARLYVESILPVDVATEATVGGAVNDWIRDANEMIRGLCEEYGASYIDVRDGMTDAAGRLRTEYTVDGVHLNGEGYRIWKENLDPYIYQTGGEDDGDF